MNYTQIMNQVDSKIRELFLLSKVKSVLVSIDLDTLPERIESVKTKDESLPEAIEMNKEIEELFKCRNMYNKFIATCHKLKTIKIVYDLVETSYVTDDIEIDDYNSIDVISIRLTYLMSYLTIFARENKDGVGMKELSEYFIQFIDDQIGESSGIIFETENLRKNETVKSIIVTGMSVGSIKTIIMPHITIMIPTELPESAKKNGMPKYLLTSGRFERFLPGFTRISTVGLEKKEFDMVMRSQFEDWVENIIKKLNEKQYNNLKEYLFNTV